MRITDCRNNNNKLQKRALFQKACRPLQSSSTVRLRATEASSTLKMEARHGCQSPVWKTTTSTPLAQTAPTTRQNTARKTSQNAKISAKTPIALTHPSSFHQNQAVSVEKQARETVWRKPMAPFPRLSRHLELLPSSESFAFDWRYFHLPHTQVMSKSHPFYYV